MTAASGAKRVLNVVNDFLHLPVVEPFFFYLFWAGHLILRYPEVEGAHLYC